MKEFKTAGELEAIILSEMAQYEAPEGILIAVHPDGNSWRATATVANPDEVPDHAEWIAKLSQVADHLARRFDLMA